jgi:hypothetical protein
MSPGSFWSNACAHAIGKPLQTLLISTYASHSLTVRQLCFALLLLLACMLLAARLLQRSQPAALDCLLCL